MRFNILCDAYWEAKIDKVFDALDDTGYKQFLNQKNYGSSVNSVIILLMCQPQELRLKQRIRFSKKDQSLSLDIMLDLKLFLQIEQQQRDKIVASKIIAEVPPIIEKYKFKDFDLEKFKKDLTRLFNKV